MDGVWSKFHGILFSPRRLSKAVLFCSISLGDFQGVSYDRVGKGWLTLDCGMTQDFLGH